MVRNMFVRLLLFRSCIGAGGNYDSVLAVGQAAGTGNYDGINAPTTVVEKAADKHVPTVASQVTPDKAEWLTALRGANKRAKQDDRKRWKNPDDVSIAAKNRRRLSLEESINHKREQHDESQNPFISLKSEDQGLSGFSDFGFQVDKKDVAHSSKLSSKGCSNNVVPPPSYATFLRSQLSSKNAREAERYDLKRRKLEGMMQAKKVLKDTMKELILQEAKVLQVPDRDPSLEWNVDRQEFVKRDLQMVNAENLARGKLVALSSEDQETSLDPAVGSKTGIARYANDGRRGMDFFVDGCAQTKEGNAFPWLRLDLGKPEHVGQVKIFARQDTLKAMEALELRLGNIGGARWDENPVCRAGTDGEVAGVTPENPKGIVLKSGQMNSITCEGFGRFLYVVLQRREGQLSICELEVHRRGPSAIANFNAIIGEPFNVYLIGVGMSKNDRINVVDDMHLCGSKASSMMDPAVLQLTRPDGAPDLVDSTTRSWQEWRNVTLSSAGYYKICWCGGTASGCAGENEFSSHVGRLVTTGSLDTIVNRAGKEPGSNNDLADGLELWNATMSVPQDIAVLERGVFVTEGHRVRYLDLIHGKTYRICGALLEGNTGGIPKNALIREPAGITIRKKTFRTFKSLNSKLGYNNWQAADGKWRMGSELWPYQVFFAEKGNHQIRRITYDPLTVLTSAESDALIFANRGIMDIIAGTGNPGFSGDGNAAKLSRLDSPTGVYVDDEDILWFCDTRNNRIRIIYISENANSDRRYNIYTAIGDGPQGFGGDGKNSLSAQLFLPQHLTVTYVDPLEEDDQEGRMLRAVCYFTEAGNHVGRMVQVHFGETCGLKDAPICGIADTYVGTPMQSGTGGANQRMQYKMNAPKGITYNRNNDILYIADWGNHRIVGMPTAQIVSLGCWRDSTDPGAYILKSLENPIPPSKYLSGDYLARQNPVKSCFQESMRLGYIVFGIRQGGECVSAFNAENTYKTFAQSTTCVDGLGSTTDNNIYKIVSSGKELDEMDRLFIVANKEGTPGYHDGVDTQLATPAINSKLHSPQGIDVDGANNIWIADSLNNRIRVVYNTVGPDPTQPPFQCVNGQRCKLEVRGNGMLPSDKIGIFPYGTVCGDPKAIFSDGFTDSTGLSTNPASQLQTDMFDAKQYDLGVPRVLKAGDFKVCFCPNQKVRNPDSFTATRVCADSRYFIADSGTLRISGPDRLKMDVRVGVAFHLLVTGTKLHIDDRIMFMNSVNEQTGVTQTCLDNWFNNPQNIVTYNEHVIYHDYDMATKQSWVIPRAFGNSTVLLWQNLQLTRSGVFLACWCNGQTQNAEWSARGPGDPNACMRKGDYQVQAAEIHVSGPYTMDGSFYLPGVKASTPLEGRVAIPVHLKLHGTNFRRTDRIRIIRKMGNDHKCGVGPYSQEWTTSMFGRAPTGPPSMMTPTSATWAELRFKENVDMLVCFCGRSSGSEARYMSIVNTNTHNGCLKNSDFNVKAGVLKVYGLDQNQPNGGEFVQTKSLAFDLAFTGNKFSGLEMLSLVESYVSCGTQSAFPSSIAVKGKSINLLPAVNTGKNEVTWKNLIVNTDVILKICYCGGECANGNNFMLEVGAVLIGGVTGFDKLQTSLLTTNPTEEQMLNFNKMSEYPVQYWSARSNILYGYILHVKTRDTPAHHGGSKGPFFVHFCKSETECLPQIAMVSDLIPGETQRFSQMRSLISPNAMDFRSIKITAGTNDAWFCESIAVYIGGDASKEDEDAFQYPNVYQVNTWIVDRYSPRSTTDGSYFFYKSNWQNANQVPAFTFPFPNRKIKNEYFFTTDPCNGCSLGYECVQLSIGPAETVWRTFNFVSGFPIGDAQADCQPRCGDGFVVGDEQCDDGNLDPDDGCSPMCKVEHAWRCVSHYPFGGPKVGTKSVCALEYCNSAPGGSNLPKSYTQTNYRNGHQTGFICSEKASKAVVPKDDTLLRCYTWTESAKITIGSKNDLCPSQSDYMGKGFLKLEGTGPATYNFRPQNYTKMDCRAYDMIERPPRRTVDLQISSQIKDAPLKPGGYQNKEECMEACFADEDCLYSQFWITQEEPSSCEFTKDCDSNCKLVTGYRSERPVTQEEVATYGSGYSYMYYKRRRGKEEHGGGDYFCSVSKAPEPASVYYTQDFGAAIVRYDDDISGVGRLLGIEIPCANFTAETSRMAIGYATAQCVWKSPRHLYIQFGAAATIGNAEWAVDKIHKKMPSSTVGEHMMVEMHPYDRLRQVQAGSSTISLKAENLKPRGQEMMKIDKDKTYFSTIKSGPGLVAKKPQVILRGPASIGSCADVEFHASESHTSGMRRWKSVQWTCMEVRPLDENKLTQIVRETLLAYCETHITPLLNAKPWCPEGSGNSMDGVRPCDLRVRIPLNIACNLQAIRMKVTITTFNGHTASAETLVERMPKPFLPTATAVGPDMLVLPMEISDDKPIHFEVMTKIPEYLEDCYSVCPASTPAPTVAAPGGASAVASLGTANQEKVEIPWGMHPMQNDLRKMKADSISVKWFYGYFQRDQTGKIIPPQQMDLYSVDDQNESVNINVLHIKNFKRPSQFYQPTSSYYFAAAVTYSTRSQKEIAFASVPFRVDIARVAPPDIKIRAPRVVQGSKCGFIVDAALSEWTELRAWGPDASVVVDAPKSNWRDQITEAPREDGSGGNMTTNATAAGGAPATDGAASGGAAAGGAAAGASDGGVVPAGAARASGSGGAASTGSGGSSPAGRRRKLTGLEMHGDDHSNKPFDIDAEDESSVSKRVLTAYDLTADAIKARQRDGKTLRNIPGPRPTANVRYPSQRKMPYRVRALNAEYDPKNYIFMRNEAGEMVLQERPPIFESMDPKRRRARAIEEAQKVIDQQKKAFTIKAQKAMDLQEQQRAARKSPIGLKDENKKRKTRILQTQTTTTTPFVPDMASWDGLQYQTDPRYIHCMDEFPALREIENPTGAVAIRPICEALNGTNANPYCVQSLLNARMDLMTLPPTYCQTAAVNCTGVLVPPLETPTWCKGEPVVTDPDTVTNVGNKPPREHKLVFQWTCRKLPSEVDDEEPTTPLTESLQAEINAKLDICNTGPGFEPGIAIPVGLRPGLYEFNLEAFDRATDMLSPRVKKSVIIQVVGAESEDVLPLTVDADFIGAKFTDMGRGPTCVKFDHNVKQSFMFRRRGTDPQETMMNLLAVDIDDPSSYKDIIPTFHALKEASASFVYKRKDLGQLVKESASMDVYYLKGYSEALELGFEYDFMAIASLKSEPTHLAAFNAYVSATNSRLQKVKENPEFPYRFQTETTDLDGMQKIRSMASHLITPALRPGSSTIAATPSNGKSVVDTFRFDMIWATNYAPLMYKFRYAVVPQSLMSYFTKARDMNESPVDRRNALAFLGVELETVMKEMRGFGFRSDMETTFAVGKFVICGTARDTNGAIGKAYTTVDVRPLWQDSAVFSAEKKLNNLDNFLVRTTKAMAKLRGENQPGGEILMTYEILLNDLPDFTGFDWEYVALNFDPAFEYQQPLQGKPFATASHRDNAIAFCEQALRSMKLAAAQLHGDNFYKTPEQLSLVPKHTTSTTTTTTIELGGTGAPDPFGSNSTSTSSTTPAPSSRRLRRGFDPLAGMLSEAVERDILDLKREKDAQKGDTAERKASSRREPMSVHEYRELQGPTCLTAANADFTEESAHLRHTKALHCGLSEVNALFHVNALSNSLLLLTKQVAVFKNETVDLMISEVVTTLMERFRNSHGDLYLFSNAAEELLTVEALLLERMKPIMLDRNQLGQYFNYTEHVATRTSRQVLEGVVKIGEAYVATRKPGEQRSISASFWDDVDKKTKKLHLTVVRDSVTEFALNGYNLIPNANLNERWPFPFTRVKALGIPVQVSLKNNDLRRLQGEYGYEDFRAADMMRDTQIAEPPSSESLAAVNPTALPLKLGDADADDVEDLTGAPGHGAAKDMLRQMQDLTTVNPTVGTGEVVHDFRPRNCYVPTENFLDFVAIYSISWPKDPFTYAYGDLGIKNNISMVYSVGLRSCGEPLLVEKKSVLELDIRLEPDFVSKHRYGYGDVVPYTLMWWREDYLDAGQELALNGRMTPKYNATREWTAAGCKTTWSKAREDMVYGRCDHIINQFSNGFAGGYQVFGLDVKKRPVFAQPPPVWANMFILNNLSYWLAFLGIIFFFLRRAAANSDKAKFWPSEQTLLQILFLMAEQDRLARLKDHEMLQNIAREEAKDPFYKVLRKRKLRPIVLDQGVLVCITTTAQFLFEFVFKVNRVAERVDRWQRRRLKARAIKSAEWQLCVRAGDETMLTNEVRELRAMRIQTRNRLYEHFLQVTELHPDDVEIDGQTVKIRTAEDLLGSSQGTESEQDTFSYDEDGPDAPPMPQLNDVIFDNEEKDDFADFMLADQEGTTDQFPALPPGWEEQEPGKFRNLLTQFISIEMPHEPAWGNKELLPGWMLCFSKQHDRAYFFYPETSVTQWKFPDKDDHIPKVDPADLIDGKTLQQLQAEREADLNKAPDTLPSGKKIEEAPKQAKKQQGVGVNSAVVQNPDSKKVDAKATHTLNATLKHQQGMQGSSKNENLAPGPTLPTNQNDTMTESVESDGFGSMEMDEAELAKFMAEGGHKANAPNASSPSRPSTARSSAAKSSVARSTARSSRINVSIADTNGSIGSGGKNVHNMSLVGRSVEGGSSSSSASPSIRDVEIIYGSSEASPRVGCSDADISFPDESQCAAGDVRSEDGKSKRGRRSRKYHSDSGSSLGSECIGGSSSSTANGMVTIPMPNRRKKSHIDIDAYHSKMSDRVAKGFSLPFRNRVSSSKKISPEEFSSKKISREVNLPPVSSKMIDQECLSDSAVHEFRKYNFRNAAFTEGIHCKSPLQSPRQNVNQTMAKHVPGNQTQPQRTRPKPNKPPPGAEQRSARGGGQQLALADAGASQSPNNQQLAIVGSQQKQGAGHQAQQLAIYNAAKRGGAPSGSVGVPRLPRNWEVHVSQDGKLYYVNAVENLSQWEVPVLRLPWRELLSAEGTLYYWNQETGQTQWLWPRQGEPFFEESEFDDDRETSDEDHSQLALYSGPQGGQQETTLALAIPQKPETPAQDVLALAEKAVSGVATGDKRWGLDDGFNKWQSKEEEVLAKKKAVARQHRTANQLKGIRDFVKPHEQGAYQQNWNKYMDSVQDKKTKLIRNQKEELGKQAELDKAQLRSMFPIVQRLTWTKWDKWKRFRCLFLKFNPVVHIFQNYARPTKMHREQLFELRLLIALFIFSFAVFGEHDVVDDGVSAADTPTTDILQHPFHIGFRFYYFIYIAFADILSSYCVKGMESVFFTLRLNLNEYQLDEEERSDKMKYWHKVAFTGATFLKGQILILFFFILVFSATHPQPRATVAVLIFMFYLGWVLIFKPFFFALGHHTILNMALTSNKADGWLSYYPGTMDFLYVGVRTAEFLAWRLHRIMKEEIIMKEVHESEYAIELYEQILETERAASRHKPPKKQSNMRKNLKIAAEKYKD